jgi:hypothetical protein
VHPKIIEDFCSDPHQYPDPLPHPLVRSMDPRIRIRTSMSRIWNTVRNLIFSSAGVGSVGSSREDTPFEDWWMGRITVCCGF